MGREIRRVPLNFTWPLHKVWPGFLNPHYRPCLQCATGYSRSYDIVFKPISALMLGESDPHVARITGFLADRPRGRSFGHDSIDAYAAVKHLGTLAGLPEDWLLCPTCHGAAIDLAVKDVYAAWVETDPPAGDGWQVWETVSEGSPISPVCDSREALIRWLVTQGYSAEAADQFTAGGWAPSMVIADGKIYRDIEACATMSPVTERPNHEER